MLKKCPTKVRAMETFWRKVLAIEKLNVMLKCHVACVAFDSCIMIQCPVTRRSSQLSSRQMRKIARAATAKGMPSRMHSTLSLLLLMLLIIVPCIRKYQPQYPPLTNNCSNSTYSVIVLCSY